MQSPVKRQDGASSSQTPKRPTQKQTKSRNKTAAVSTQNTPTPDSKMTEPKSTLIIGSSITGKIRTRGLRSNARVRTMRGAQVSDIRQEIQHMNLTGTSDIIIQAGGNDVSNGRDMDAIENDFAEIILDVQHRSPSTSVFISEVTPRWNLDPTDVNDRIASVCEMYNAKVIRSSFAINRYNTRQFCKDGIHLNKAGTRDLLYAFEQYVAVLKNGIKLTVCSYCGENGHSSKNCRHGGKLVCYSCRESGHKAKHCGYY